MSQTNENSKKINEKFKGLRDKLILNKKIHWYKFKCYGISILLILMFIVLLIFTSYQLLFMTLDIDYNIPYPIIYYTIFFIAQLGVSYALFSIPLILVRKSIKKKFQDDKLDLYSLKERIIQIRRNAINALNLNKDIREINSLNLNTIALNDLKNKLRKFNLAHDADTFDFCLERKEIYRFDILFFKIFELLKQYDGGKQWHEYKESHITETILNDLNGRNIGDLDDVKYLKYKFLTDFDYAIVYRLFYDRGSVGKLGYIYNYLYEDDYIEFNYDNEDNIYSIQYSPVGINETQQKLKCKKRLKEVLIDNEFHEVINRTPQELKEIIDELSLNKGVDFNYDPGISPKINDYDL